MSAIARAFELARTGEFENFTAVKRALRHEFHVDRELVGKQLSTDVTRVCKEARGKRTQEPEQRAGAPG